MPNLTDDKVIAPYYDVPYAELPTATDEQEGMYRGVKELQIGFGSRVLRADQQGLWLGAERFEDAPFSVDMEGNIVASSLDLSNFLEIGGAAADVNSHGTTITGTKITTGTIDANKLNVSQLSAITADMGSLTSGTITGALIRTASSGTRTQLSGTNNRLEIYSGSTLRAIAYEYGHTYYNTSGTRIGDIFASSGTILIDSTQSSSNSIQFIHGNSGSVSMGTSGAVYFYSSGSLGVNVAARDIIPASGADLGDSGNLWGTVYTNFLEVDDDIFVDDGVIDISSGFLNLASMSGATADARGDYRNGSMYYRSDTGTIRVRLSGAWKTITTS